MCGRYYRRSDKQRIAEAFHLGKLPKGFALPADYNVAPATFQPVIRQQRETGKRELVMMRWGMIPFFAETADKFKDLSTINARSNTLLESPLWREPFKRRRCLVPADGLYEWPKPGKAIDPDKTQAVGGSLFPGIEPKPPRLKAAKPAKKVFAISLANDQPFAFAGIWDTWKIPTGGILESFALVTTEPNELVATIHDRLALILHPRDYDRRLITDGNSGAPRLPVDLLRPYEASEMKMEPANPAVGNWRNNGPALLIGK